MSEQNLKRKIDQIIYNEEELKNNNENQNFNNEKNLTNNSNSKSNDLLQKKKVKMGIKKENEPILVSNANEIIFFKIVNSQKEFEDFQKCENMEYCFNPYFTNQVINDTETITGYKNLKILISLTPKLFYPHFKFIYESFSIVKDDLVLLFKTHFGDRFEMSEEKFLKKLEDEINSDLAPVGELVNKNDSNLEVYYVDILKEQALVENSNFQAICTFFIDGASFIPIEDNYWSYFTLYEKGENIKIRKLLGFASCVNVNLTATKHRTMISQFLIFPPFQRRGLGHFLLDKIYDYYTQSDWQCVEITTEDPAEEFILLRDITLFKKIIHHGYFDKFIRTFPLKSEKEFVDVILSKKEINEISKSFKMTTNLVKRCVTLFKYTLVNQNEKLYALFKKECQDLIFKWNRGDFEIDYILKSSCLKGGPYISFHDDPDFNVQDALNEIKFLNSSEMSKNEKLEMLFAELENEFKKISYKCSKIVDEYKNNLK